MNPDSPLVTVLVPNYNHEKYLPLRIESIINQTFTDFELILMDDCSTDGSVAILEQYAISDKRISVILNNKNSGSTFKQWKKGISLAKGKYLWIAESDDFAELNFLSTLIPILENNPSIALAYTNSNIVDSNNKASGTTADWKNTALNTSRWSNDFLVKGIDELNNFLSRGCTINNASAVLFRHACIQSAGGVDDSFRYTGDWSLYQKISLIGDIAYIANCLSNYREHVNNASKKSAIDGSQLFERLKCYAYLFRLKSLNEASHQRMIKDASAELFSLFNTLLRINPQPKLLIKYINDIIKISLRFYIKIQMRSVYVLLLKEY